MNVDQFDFELPEQLIAQTPLLDRTASRLLVLDRKSGEIKDTYFKEIVDELNEGDCLVLNDTKVLPARLIGVKEDTGAKVEVLLLKERGNNEWETLVKRAKRVKVGNVITFGDGSLKAVCTEELDHGGRVFVMEYDGIFHEILDRLGQMPLPPYIKETLKEKDRYQTVYAKHHGSAAAPTAGLHFTEEILQQIRNKGVHIAFITLHVGLGTFRPVSVEKIEDHKMHEEFYEMSEETAELLTNVKERGGKIIAVGTTSVRTLETIVKKFGQFRASSGWTDIFIYPGVELKAIDGMITNFHLPKSTLIMLVSALAGRENILRAYRHAVKEKYRFFSFGDAMFIR